MDLKKCVAQETRRGSVGVAIDSTGKADGTPPPITPAAVLAAARYMDSLDPDYAALLRTDAGTAEDDKETQAEREAVKRLLSLDLSASQLQLEEATAVIDLVGDDDDDDEEIVLAAQPTQHSGGGSSGSGSDSAALAAAAAVESSCAPDDKGHTRPTQLQRKLAQQLLMSHSLTCARMDVLLGHKLAALKIDG